MFSKWAFIIPQRINLKLLVFIFHYYQYYISDSITKTIIRSAHSCVHDIRVYNRHRCKEDKLIPPENVVGILHLHEYQNETAG